jgi:uracil-DNA glycosylase
MKPLSVFQQHRQRWKDGCGSSICEGATKCFARGSIPCDVLFVGEAPGPSENVLGSPFVGPAGQLLDKIVQRCLDGTTINCELIPEIRWCFTNLVMCIPINPEDGQKFAEPAAEDIECCKSRLEEFIAICQPRLIVCVGKLADTWFKPGFKHSVEHGEIPTVSIVHPAAILRANHAARGLMVQRCEVTIRNAMEDL